MNSPIELNAQLFEYIAERYGNNKPSWLDIGAGDGRISVRLSWILGTANYVAIDKKPTTREVATMSAESLDFEDKRFDFTLLNYVLHHTADPKKCLSEALRVSNCVIVQEDIDDGTHNTRFLLIDHAGSLDGFHSLEGWSEIAGEIGARMIFSEMHPRTTPPMLESYDVPRALFALLPSR